MPIFANDFAAAGVPSLRVATSSQPLQVDRPHQHPASHSLSSPQVMPPSPTSLSTTATDADLVARLSSGEERALAELYDRHSAVAYGLARAIVRDATDAEEVVADCFAQMWRTAASFDSSRGSVAAWVTTIVRTRALDLIRAQRRRARVLDEAAVITEEEGGSGAGMPAPSDTPDRDVERAEARELVRRSLAELPQPQRRVLELAYFGGMSQSEIAEFLKEPLGTVKTRMRAGLEKLRTALRPILGAEALP
jgi:RNA polymerase sigma-70 factor (ECF subfamily)